MSMLRCGHRRYCADALMFSIDYPYESSYEAVQGFERNDTVGRGPEKIAHGNAERLLRI